MRYIRYAALAFIRIPQYLILGVSFCLPRSRAIWIFDSWRGERFADNTKYLFLHVNDAVPGIRAVWLTRSTSIAEQLRREGYDAYTARSLRGRYFTVRAKFLIFDSEPSISYWLSGGMTMINLWHGLPLKKIAWDMARTKQHGWRFSASPLRRAGHGFLTPWKLLVGDYMLIPSAFWSDIFAGAFRISRAQLMLAGYPRNDVLVRDIEDCELGADGPALDAIGRYKERGMKIVMYMPTFRDGSNNPFANQAIDFMRLDAFLKERDAHLYLKFHHEGIADFAGLSNVHVIDSASDAYPLLKQADVLVTDYSSVYFDFLVLDRPIVFFPFDIDDYRESKRELYFDYDEVTPGPKAYSSDELFGMLSDALAGKDGYAAARQELFARFFDARYVGRAGGAVAEGIQEIAAA